MGGRSRFVAEDATGRVRILLYNWRTEAVRALPLANDALRAERSRMSN